MLFSPSKTHSRLFVFSAGFEGALKFFRYHAYSDMDGMMGLAGNTCAEIPSTGTPVKVNPGKPVLGVLFNDTEEVHAFYRNYARLEESGIVGGV